MLSGIGLIIILKQIPHAFGYDADPEGDFRFFQVDGHTTLSELSYMTDTISPGAIIISVISMFILILWDQPFMKKISLFNVVQGPLIVVSAGILMNYLFKGFDFIALNPDQVVNIPVAESISGFIGQFTLPDFTQFGNSVIIFLKLIR